MKRRYHLQILVLLAALGLTSSCSSSDSDPICNSAALLFDNSICLSLEHSGLSEDLKKAIEEEVSEGLTLIQRHMPIDHLQIRIVDDPRFVIPELGIGGFNPNDAEVLIAMDITSIHFPTSLENELISILAHEIHHAKRRRSVGYGHTLLQAAVSEGLADHFSIEISRKSPPPWSVAVTGENLDAWIRKANQIWNAPNYDHRAWFFGVDPEIPRWVGYSIGYSLVSRYLSENPGSTAANLNDEPADSFRP